MMVLPRIVVLATLFIFGAAMAAGAPKVRTYILNGYSLSGVPGINPAELQAKLKDKPGAHITQADIHADTAIVAKELAARHIEGHLFTTLAERHGRVWIIFDLLNPEAGQPPLGQLVSQTFEGASRLSANALALASGLKPGDQLSREKLSAAGRAIKSAYAKVMPGKRIALKIKVQHKQGKASLIWIIGEPK